MEKIADENISTTVTISRLMLPDDANNAGNVHGGTTLKMVEEAGAIVATRWCNLKKISSDEATSAIACFALLARIEHMDFIHPIHIGQVAHVEATITFSSKHSLLVIAKVYGEDIIAGGKKLTNVAHMWYVPVSVEPPNLVRPVPPITYASAEEEAAGNAALERQKSERRLENGASRRMRTFSLSTPLVYEPVPFTVAYSRTVLCHMLGVADVGLGGFCKGGVTLKMMDECGGITAMRHCQTFVVTASIEATNFHERVPKGALMTVKGQVVFTSANSIVTEVVVEFEQRFANYKSEKGRAVDAYFTYVSIGKDSKAQKVPQLLINGPEEQALFDAAKVRYEKRKMQRAAEKLASQAKAV